MKRFIKERLRRNSLKPFFESNNWINDDEDDNVINISSDDEVIIISDDEDVSPVDMLRYFQKLRTKGRVDDVVENILPKTERNDLPEKIYPENFTVTRVPEELEQNPDLQAQGTSNSPSFLISDDSSSSPDPYRLLVDTDSDSQDRDNEPVPSLKTKFQTVHNNYCRSEIVPKDFTVLRKTAPEILGYLDDMKKNSGDDVTTLRLSEITGMQAYEIEAVLKICLIFDGRNDDNG